MRPVAIGSGRPTTQSAPDDGSRSRSTTTAGSAASAAVKNASAVCQSWAPAADADQSKFASSTSPRRRCTRPGARDTSRRPATAGGWTGKRGSRSQSSTRGADWIAVDAGPP